MNDNESAEKTADNEEKGNGAFKREDRQPLITLLAKVAIEFAIATLFKLSCKKRP